MKIDYDQAKRDLTFVERGRDMAEVGSVFAGPYRTFADRRVEYGEERHVTFGYPNGRLLAVAWTMRDDERRVITLRKANARERRKIEPSLRS